MSRKTNKTPAELLLELETRAANIRLRVAKEKAASNPALARIQDVRDSYSRDINVHGRKLAGPNSFANRKKSIELRSAWIEAEERLVTAEDKTLRDARKYLDDCMATLAKQIDEGKEITVEQADTMLKAIPEPANLSDLRIACNDAETAWRTFTQGLKAKNADPVETPSETLEASEGA